jgi:hypothetical protein
MNEYFDRTLVEDFPELYRDRYGDMRQTAMCWGFDCGDGWEQIIRALSQDLEVLRVKCGLDVRAVQVKEKWGTLRFYADMADGNKWLYAVARHLINVAEDRSSFTCEICGAWGTRRDGGWIKILCDKCYEKRKTSGRNGVAGNVAL